MSNDNRKRHAEDQMGRDPRDDREPEEFVTTPQIASAEVMAGRKIVTARRAAPPAPSAENVVPAASAAPAAASPFGSVLGPFGAATVKVAASPFAAFGGSTAPPVAAANPFATNQGFSFNFGAAPAAVTPAAAPVSAAPAVPAAGGFSFNFGAKVDFNQAVNAFAVAQKAAESATATAAAAAGNDSGDDEDPEAEVPPTSGATAAPVFEAVDVTTGEEGETTVIEINAKLFELSKEDKKWHERGSGSLKINTKEVDGAQRARVVMRDSKLKKGLLNCLLDESFRFGQRQEKHFSVTVPHNASVSTFLVKVSGTKPAEDTKAFLEAADARLKH